MKKIILGLFLIPLLFTSGCRKKENMELVDKVLETINLPNETSEDLTFNTSYEVNGKTLEVIWQPSNEEIIDNFGKITRGFEDQIVEIDIIIKIDNQLITKSLGTIKVLGYSEIDILKSLKDNFKLPNEISNKIDFPNSLTLLGKNASITWISSNKNVISNNGTIYYTTSEQKVTMTANVIIENKIYNINYGEIIVPARNATDIINDAILSLNLPISTMTNIYLPTKLGNVNITWSSSNTNALSSTGKWIFNPYNTNVTLTALFIYGGKIVEKQYPINVLTLPDEDRMNWVLEDISLPEYVSENINLPTAFDYGVTGVWQSSNNNIIDNSGFVNLSSIEHIITLTLKLTSGDKSMNKDFTITTTTIKEGEVYFNNHMLVDRADSFITSSMKNLILDNNKIVLNATSTEGSYESPIYTTNLFDRLVGSWAAISDKHATCELQIKVRVNNTWSSYLSYSKWGLGLQNALLDQDGNVARMADDEIVVNSGQKADAFQYKITLRRDSLVNQSPKLSLVGITLSIPGFQYNVDTKNLPDFVDYDVPKLNQNIVPVIGNSICSITSSTMLLMYKGHKFTDEMPHRENAPLFFDYGNKIYGNWVYNVVGMGAFGESTYVKRIYSFDELKYHLVNVGPVALSIKGNTGLYSTNGHLIVVRGYRVSDTGTKVICNDPNLANVYYEYPLETFMSFTRNVIYVIE